MNLPSPEPFDRVTRIEAVKPGPGNHSQLDGSVACLCSHIETLRRALDAGYRNILVLEDDFCFTSDLEQHLTDLAVFFERSYPYWVCLIATINTESLSQKTISYRSRFNLSQMRPGNWSLGRASNTCCPY